jgi:hypothetical protein
MKPLLIHSIVTMLMLASPACYAEWPKQRFVQIQNEPASGLCASAAKAVQTVRKEADGRLFNKFRASSTRISKDTAILGLTFYAQRTQKIAVLNRKGVERTNVWDYYLLDIDNNGSTEMVTLASGGLGAAGDGDTLSVLNSDPSSGHPPVPIQAFMDVALEIGPLQTSFQGRDDFDPGYYIYPFAFKEKNYLLLEGNRWKDARVVVAELVPSTGIVTRCYF